MSALAGYAWHYWAVSEELAAGTSRVFICQADGGFRTSAPENVTCGWCLAWLRSGPRQRLLLAKANPERIIIPNGNAERCAVRRLARRGVVRRYRLGGPGMGYLTIYKVATP